MTYARRREVENMLVQKGYTIKKFDAQAINLEHESDSIEQYKMISNEFDYD